MTIYILCLLIGIVAGLRTMTAVAAVSWAAAFGQLQLGQTWLAFLGYRWTPYILTLLALAELGTDKLPSSPSRTVPIQLGARILAGALSGAAIGATHDALLIGAALGIVGALVGTYGGSAIRDSLKQAFGRDLPAGLLEDAVAVGGSALIVFAVR